MATMPQVDTRFDVELGVYWAYMSPKGRACFNEGLLSDLNAYIGSFRASGGVLRCGGGEHRVRYGVLASKVKRVFNLGGDLELFRTAIQAGNRSRLVAYGQRCIDNLYLWHRNCDLDLTTIALVEGDALGGGFEAALSASVLIAEEGSRLGFPEVLFNLFPGMGAFSFLQRKVGRRIATELITSGDLYTGRQLWEMGVVDVLAPDGEGELALYKFVKKHARNGNGRRGFERGTLEVNVVDRGELERVVEIWADTALRLTDRDLKMMERLVRAQDRINEIIERPNSNIVPIGRIAGGD